MLNFIIRLVYRLMRNAATVADMSGSGIPKVRETSPKKRDGDPFHGDMLHGEDVI